jgi:hypothetical protein
MRPILKWGATLAAVLFLFAGAADAQSYVSTVLGTNPLAYFRLEASPDTSLAGGYLATFHPGVTLAGTGAPICVTPNHSATFNGTTGQITTTLAGGINTAGSMAAWVNLATLPSTAGQFFYIAGESQLNNDFDLQFTTDNFVRFYVSDNSINVGYQPNAATLAGQWHFVVATFNAATNTENLYWDGQFVATANNTVFPGKTLQFNMGASTVFTGRNFAGSVDEVAVWNTALTAAQVSAIYNSASCSVQATPAPPTWTLAILGLILLGATGLLMSRKTA